MYKIEMNYQWILLFISQILWVNNMCDHLYEKNALSELKLTQDITLQTTDMDT